MNPRQDNPQASYTTVLLLIVALLLPWYSAVAQSLTRIDQLTALPQPVQDEINQLCLPSQYRDGAAAFRDCIAREIEYRNSDNALLLDSYSFDEKFAIQQSCSSSTSSIESYVNCVRNEVKKLDTVPEPDPDVLAEDELNALQLSCNSVQQNEGAARYRSCVNAAKKDLLAIPRADLSLLPADIRNEIKTVCTNASRNGDPGNYRLCIAEGLAHVLLKQRDERSGNGAGTDDAATTPVQSEVGIPTSTADGTVLAEAGTALTDGLADSSASATTASGLPEDTQSTDSTESTAVSAEITSDTTERSLQRPVVQVTTLNPSTGNNDSTGDDTILDALPDIDAASAEGVSEERDIQPGLVTAATSDAGINNPEASTEAEIALPPLSMLFDSPAEFFSKLEAQHYRHYLKYMFPVLVILLALKLLGLILGKRNREMSTAEYQPVSFPDDEFTRQFDDPAFSTASQQTAQPPDLSDPFGETPLQNQALNQPDHLTNPPSFDFLDEPVHEAGESAAEQTSGPALLDQTIYTPVYSESEFGQWIHQQPAEDHKRLCTEFMLYWVSYGDGNYTPELKAELMRAVDLNEHDLIKKWVLEQNPSTLVDMLQRVWSIFSKAEVEQTISMMLAVLVKNEISPVQNTFFRFLADFAHLGTEGLDRLYLDAFGSKLPPLPRPDDERWWQRQAEKPDNTSLAHASEGADGQAQSDREICLALLGLPERASREEIESIYTQIANRCDPARFDQLGEKERGLVQRHLAKYTQAYEYLMEEDQ